MHQITVVSNLATMSSREISYLVESRHDNVKVTIERLAEKGVIQLPALQDVKNKQGQSVSEYRIGKRDSYIIVAQLSPEFTAKLVDRWQELEEKLTAKQKSVDDRKTSRIEFFPMMDAVKSNRAIDGKECKPHHFSNEADLLNRIALGMTAAKFRSHHELDSNTPLRDCITQSQLNCIKDLQRANTAMLQMGDSFNHRKERLTLLFNRNHKQLLIDEIKRLES